MLDLRFCWRPTGWLPAPQLLNAINIYCTGRVRHKGGNPLFPLLLQKGLEAADPSLDRVDGCAGDIEQSLLHCCLQKA